MTAVVFDLDGLMVDSEPLARQAWDAVLQAHGVRLDDAVHGRMVGRRTPESAAIVREAYDLAVPVEELARAKTRQWDEIWRRGLPPLPGLFALHDALADRAIPWAVATSSQRDYAAAVLRQLGLAAQCGALAAGNEVAHGKPAPDIYLLAAARLGIAPQKCLALEDSAPGAQAAKSAGMRVAVIPNGTPASAYPEIEFRFDSLADVAAQLDTLLA